MKRFYISKLSQVIMILALKMSKGSGHYLNCFFLIAAKGLSIGDHPILIITMQERIEEMPC